MERDEITLGHLALREALESALHYGGADAVLDLYDMRAIQRLIKDVAYEKPEWLSDVSMPARVVDWAMEAP